LIDSANSSTHLTISHVFIHVNSRLIYISVANRIAAHSQIPPSATGSSDVISDLLGYIFRPMSNIQAFDPSVSLLVAPESPLLAYIVHLLHIICVHLTVKLLIVHGQQVVQPDHISETIHLLMLLLLLWS
jgi:hypothetical protein